jgi:hypothetical protein
MTSTEIPEDHRERIEALRAELAAAHAGAYATVETADVLAYLLDLADAVNDPDRSADPEPPTDPGPPFDREAVRERLAERNRRHTDPEDADRMDLYTVAAEFDVAGRSEMTKDELLTAVLDEAERLAANPFAAVDVDVPGTADGDAADDESGTDAVDADAADGDATDGDGGSSQLDAMMSLLDTHDDKWGEADGDARYEVELPDGTVETARTKDDVRALLFKNY